jgi:hypothetical protein
MTDRRRLEEKLRDAARSVGNPDTPLRDRLKAAYSRNLAVLDPADFPDDEGRAEFEAIRAELTAVGEAGEGEGSVTTTLWLASDEQAQALADRIVKLAARYGQT